MDMLEAIRARRSVRTFDPGPVPQGEAQKILDFAAGAKNPYGLTIDWQLLDAGEHGLKAPVILGAETYITGKLPRVPHAEEAFGFSFERVLLYAQTLGYGATWIAGTMDRAAFERAVSLREGEVMPCVSPLGVPAARMSLRETMMRKGIKADTRFSFEELFFSGFFDTPLARAAAGDLETPLELVRLAPSAVNKQPWRVVVCDGAAHFYEKRTKGYVDASGWDLQKVDMGIALCHFMLGAEALGFRPGLTWEDPGLRTPPDTLYIATVSSN